MGTAAFRDVDVASCVHSGRVTAPAQSIPSHPIVDDDSFVTVYTAASSSIMAEQSWYKMCLWLLRHNQRKWMNSLSRRLGRHRLGLLPRRLDNAQQHRQPLLIPRPTLAHRRNVMTPHTLPVQSVVAQQGRCVHGTVGQGRRHWWLCIDHGRRVQWHTRQHVRGLCVRGRSVLYRVCTRAPLERGRPTLHQGRCAPTACRGCTCWFHPGCVCTPVGDVWRACDAVLLDHLSIK